ncbi:MAG: 4Fe-4S binding protein [Candidatus Bathyarchaeota archaeon]|nr:4Fe-4S binding protein [Candidatus Bathyarchaeota archaeon]
MEIRKIVRIDEELCNGCGLCIPKCAEEALQIIDGKARLVRDNYCDGLGACLGHCPQGAILIIEREAEAFDEEAVHAHLARKKPSPPTGTSALRQWPVQLNLVPSKAAFFDDSDLLVIADCVPLAYPNVHGSLLSKKSVVMGCPKFDDAQGYVKKLTEILKNNNVKSISVAHMEVPCCSGLLWIVKKAIDASGKQIPLEQQEITIRGEIE